MAWYKCGVGQPKKKYQKRRGFKLQVNDVSSPALEQDAKDVKKAMKKNGALLGKAMKGEPLMIRQNESVDHAQRVANSILVHTLNEIGLDARSMALKLKTAIDLSLETGKVIKDPNDPSGKKSICIPDLKAFKDLAFLWGNWMKVGRVGGIQQQNNFFGPSGLDEAGRQRVAGLVERIEAEAQRRGLPGVHAVGPEPEDAQALPGVADAGDGESAPAD